MVERQVELTEDRVAGRKATRKVLLTRRPSVVGKDMVDSFMIPRLNKLFPMLGILRLMFTPGSKWKRYMGLWGLCISLVALYCYLNYVLVEGTGEFTTLLTAYSADHLDFVESSPELKAASDLFKKTFQRHTLKIAGLLTITSLIYSIFLSVSHMLAEVNREHITIDTLSKFMYKNVFYVVSMNNKEIDNLDARFCSDVQQFGWHFVNCAFGNIYYTGVIPTIGQAICFTYLVAITGGGLAVAIAYISFVIFIGSNLLISNWVSKSKYASSTSEQNYQKLYARLGVNAETVAFYRGGQDEMYKILASFRQSQAAYGVYYFRFFFINFSVNFYYWFSTILNYALPGIIVMIQKDVITASDALSLITLTAYNSYLQSTLCYSIYCTEAFSNAIAYATRIIEAKELVNEFYWNARENESQSSMEESDHVELAAVTMVTPSNVILLENLSFKCRPTDRLLIKGPSGTGKSSILRIICGLWPAKSGSIKYIAQGTFFMPQKPYLTVGTLREQFSYPSQAEDVKISDEALVELLKKIDMDYILERYNLDSIEDWGNRLSGGEQQRIGMARLFFRKPQFAVLDECTSAVSDEMEAKFYDELITLGVTFISVSHRMAVAKYHDCVLHLLGDGSYTFERLKPHSEEP